MTVYFPNWHIHSDSRAQVRNLPWDRLECVNHAFWKVVPRDGGFALASTDPRTDTDPEDPRAHFRQYAECAERTPGKKILLSIGGWTACGFFSEMALTEESRASFIRSCVETLEEYPFFSGLDIDWEYPGVARTADGANEGNPVLGEDRVNYTLFLSELRKALDGHFGPGSRLLTVCAGATVSVLSQQDYTALHPYVDRVNLMTYDLAGPWNNRTGHQTALYGEQSADTAVKYLLDRGVPAEKIAIGSPLYGNCWRIKEGFRNPVGAAAEGLADSGLTWNELSALEKTAVPEGVPGWHKGYDQEAEVAWLWNDDPVSPDDRLFYSYEDTASLDAKLNYIRNRGLGGLIVWEAHGDNMDLDWPMLTRMYGTAREIAESKKPER